MATEKICTVEGCTHPARAKGYCQKHYQNARRNDGKAISTRPNVKDRVPRTCQASDCDRFAYAKGYCRMHYERQRRNGDIELRRGSKSKARLDKE